MTVRVTSELAYEVADNWQQPARGASHKDVPAVAVDSHDRVFLFTRNDSQVLVYDSDGRFVETWGKGIFASGHGITIGPDDSVYCVDNEDHTIRKFTPDGRLLMTIGTPGVCSETGYVLDPNNRALASETIRCAAGPFNKCCNLALAPNGDIYVADGYGNARVHQFSAKGELLRSWGEPGSGPGQFRLPHGIWITPDERLLVADRENERIQFFDLYGKYLYEWTDVQFPCQVQSDAAGLIYVAELCVRPGAKSFTQGIAAEEAPGRVSIFDANGTLLARWGSLVEPCAPGNFVAPHDLCLDSKGNLYVAEVCWTMGGRVGRVPADCHQIQKFTRQP